MIAVPYPGLCQQKCDPLPLSGKGVALFVFAGVKAKTVPLSSPDPPANLS
jgi:hypothetical protein